MRSDQIKAYMADRYFAIAPSYMDQILAAVNAGIPKLEENSDFQGSHGYTTQGDVAIIVADGVTIKKNTWINAVSGGFIGYDTLATYVEKAEQDPSINTTFIIADTRGGEVEGVEEFASQIANAKNKVIVLGENKLMSAGLWWSSGADEIYLTNTSFIGSMGVMATYQEPEDDGKLIRVSKNAENKNCSLNGDCQARIDEEINILEDIFINTVAENRGQDREKLIALFKNGGVVHAKDALDGGYINGITTRAELLETLGASPTATKRQKQTKTQGVTMSEKTHEEQIEALNSAIEAKSAKVAELEEALKLAKEEIPTKVAEQKDVALYAYDKIATHGLSGEDAKALMAMDSKEAINDKVLALVESGATNTGSTNNDPQTYGWDDYEKETK